MTTTRFSEVAACQAAAAEGYGAARAAANAGRKVAGFMCSYAPQELFHAAGYLPVRILGREGGATLADEIIQPYACSFARSALDSALANEFDFLRLAVFSHTCDTMQNVADLWRRNRPEMAVIVVSVPTQTEGAPARTFFRRELQRVRQAVEALAGPVADDALWDSIRLYQKHRAAMRRLYEVRRTHPGVISGSEMLAVVTASFFMEKQAHLELITRLADAVAACPEDTPGPRPAVLVAGSVCQNADFIKAIEESGCAVVDDDLCMGSRSFSLPDPPDGDPLESLAEIYLARTPCPAFHKPGFDAAQHMLDRARAAQADGVVFLLTKFCDPWFFDYPYISRTLEAAEMPTLLLEVEQHLPAPAQLRTRVEAFAEMLRGRVASWA